MKSTIHARPIDRPMLMVFVIKRSPPVAVTLFVSCHPPTPCRARRGPYIQIRIVHDKAEVE
jgi:hypothetical protein